MRSSEGTRFPLRIQYDEQWGFEHTTWAERGPRGANDGENKPPEAKQAGCSDAASNDNLEPTVGKSLETLPREVVQKPPRQKHVSRQDLFEFRLISRNSKYLDGGTRSEHLACSLWFPCHGNLPAKRHRDEHCGPPIDVADLPTQITETSTAAPTVHN